MIHLKHTQPGVRSPATDRVQASAEDHVLVYALPNGVSKLILRVAAARSHEGTERARKFMVFSGTGSKRFRGLDTNNAQRQRIVEHLGLVKQLMRGPADRHPLRRSTEFTFLHRGVPADLSSGFPARLCTVRRGTFREGASTSRCRGRGHRSRRT